MAVRLPLVSVLLRCEGPLPLSAATAALCAPGLGTASSRAAAATAAILLLPRRLVSGRRPPRLRRGHLPSSPSHPAAINGERGKNGWRVRGRRGRDGKSGALPGNRRRAAPAKEGRGAVWGRGCPALAPEGRKATSLQGAPRLGCLGRGRLAPPPLAAACQPGSRLAKVRECGRCCHPRTR